MAEKFKQLRVWNQSMELAKEVHLAIKQIEGQRDFALAHQLRKTLISVPSNIAEGSEAGSDKLFLRHLNIALGSLVELRCQLLLAVAFSYLDADYVKSLEKQANTVEWPLIRLKQTLVERIKEEARK